MFDQSGGSFARSSCAQGFGEGRNPSDCGALAAMEANMAEKFDPAPHDKHADDPRAAELADAEMHARLEAGLIDSFPASDPVSVTLPTHAVRGRHPDGGGRRDNENAKDASLWEKAKALFR